MNRSETGLVMSVGEIMAMLLWLIDEHPDWSPEQRTTWMILINLTPMEIKDEVYQMSGML